MPLNGLAAPVSAVNPPAPCSQSCAACRRTPPPPDRDRRPVKIDKAGGAVVAHIDAIERIVRTRQRGKPASTIVRKTAQRAVRRTHHQIEIAVPVKIDKAGDADSPHRCH